MQNVNKPLSCGESAFDAGWSSLLSAASISGSDSIAKESPLKRIFLTGVDEKFKSISNNKTDYWEMGSLKSFHF